MQEGQEITEVIVDLNNRIRTLENKYNLLGERLLVVNQNMIEEYKRLLREMKIINEDLKEMELFAKKEQVRVLEKYIDLINPMRFVTTEEVESLIIQKSVGVKRGK